MKTNMSSHSAAGRFLSRASATHASMGLSSPNPAHAASSKLTFSSVKTTKDENGNTFFRCDQSEVDGDSVVSE